MDVYFTTAASLLFSLAPLEGWFAWLSSPVNLIAVSAPVCGTAAAVTWAARLHRHALKTITELRTRIATLETEKEASDAADAAKDEFLVKLSHEIRTPMNGIIAFAELSSYTDLTSEQRQYLDTVLHSAEWLTQIIADVLDFTRMRSADVKLEEKEFSLESVATSAVKILEARAIEKHLTIACKIDERVPPLCLGDPGRLRQVLVNLLDNAVRFTTTGGVMLSARLEESLPDEYVVGFMVADTGIGIPPERQQRIFEPFQGGAKGEVRQSGAGLGLPICRHLTTLMGGSIEVQSQIGAGSTFRFTVRLKVPGRSVAPSAAPAHHTRRTARRLSILLGEFDARSRRINTKLLESAGHQVTPAASAQEAVDKFSTDLFDLVFLDGDMPDLEFVQPCQQMHEFEPDLVRTPIYLFLPNQASPNPAADGYLRKPLDVDELMAVVNRVATPELTTSGRGR